MRSRSLSLFLSFFPLLSRVPTAVREPLTRMEIGCYRVIARFLSFFVPFFPHPFPRFCFRALFPDVAPAPRLSQKKKKKIMASRVHFA